MLYLTPNQQCQSTEGKQFNTMFDIASKHLMNSISNDLTNNLRFHMSIVRELPKYNCEHFHHDFISGNQVR